MTDRQIVLACIAIAVVCAVVLLVFAKPAGGTVAHGGSLSTLSKMAPLCSVT